MIKAIQTLHKGILFRSRLEARWSVFFDTLGVRYEYEKEGYDLGGLAYLPDFYLPELKCFIEIKGQKPNYEEQMKAYRLAVNTRQPVHIFAGPIPEPGIEYWGDTGFETFSFGMPGVLFKGRYYSNSIYALNQCPKCETIGFSVRGRVDMLPCGDGPITERLSTKVIKAYRAARIARFEH